LRGSDDKRVGRSSLNRAPRAMAVIGMTGDVSSHSKRDSPKGAADCGRLVLFAVLVGPFLIPVPATILSEITIVDTPGTNAIYCEHEAMTREFIPRSDLVHFVTLVDRRFTESERAFLELIRERGTAGKGCQGGGRLGDQADRGAGIPHRAPPG